MTNIYFHLKYLATLAAILLTSFSSMYVVATPFTTKISVNKNTVKQEQPLLRRASWGAKFKTEKLADGSLGKKIIQLNNNSSLAKAGMKVEDILISINQQNIEDPEQWYDLTDALVATTPYQLVFLRDNERLNVVASFPPLAQEIHEGLITTYSQLVSESGIKQRTIITHPKKEGKQPAILFLQGLSCSSIEILPTRKNNYVKLINAIVEQSDSVVMRIEKPGVGDSEGSCSTTNFQDELAGYEAAMKKLQSLPYVDVKNITVYGNSMGSALAPYIANKYNGKAVIADGTFYRSWFEHMLEIERRILTMKGKSQSEVTQAMNYGYIPLYYGMLIEKKSYRQVIDEQKNLAEYNYHGPQHMYGRPMEYYHQLQDFDFAGEWQKLTVPVRIRWGKNDWIMSEADNDMIVEVLAAKGNADVQLVKPNGLDHWSTIHPSAVNSFTGKPGKWHEHISDQIIDWIKALKI